MSWCWRSTGWKHLPWLLAQPCVWQLLAPGFNSAGGVVTGFGRVMGAVSPPLCGLLWPPRRACSDLTGSGDSCHSLPQMLMQLCLLPMGGIRGVQRPADNPPKFSSGVVLVFFSSSNAGGGWLGTGGPFWDATRLGAAAGPFSCSSASWPSSTPSRQWASLLHY